MTIRATRGVTHHNHSALQPALAHNARFTIVFARVFKFQRDTGKDQCSVFKRQTTVLKRFVSLGGIKANAHEVIVFTLTPCSDRPIFAKQAASISAPHIDEAGQCLTELHSDDFCGDLRNAVDAQGAC